MISVQMLMMPTSVIIINTSIIRIPLMMIPNIMMIFFVLTPNPKLFCPQNTVRYLDKYTWKIHSDEYIREIHFDSIFQNVPRSIFWIFWSPLKPEKMCRFYTCLHTSKKAEFLETLSPQIFWIFRKILNWERKINTAPKSSPKWHHLRWRWHHFLSIFTIFCRFAPFTHFCRNLRTFSANFFWPK